MSSLSALTAGPQLTAFCAQEPLGQEEEPVVLSVFL